jgi:hypothetical protein
MNFETFFTALKSDEIWYNQICFMYSKKNMKLVAQQCYADLLAQPERFKKADLTDFRKCYHAWLKNSKDDYQAPQLQQKEEVKEDKEWKPASPEHVDKCVAEFDEMLKNAPMLNHYPKMPLKQQIEEGDWIPAKGAPHPKTSAMELYVRQRHLAWIELSFDPRTSQRLPDWVPEDIFNIQYDEKHSEILEKKVHKLLKKPNGMNYLKLD